jgi:class 3 adenylate cyclase
MTERTSGVVTILFTDLVDSTELISRAGDEEAQRIFRAHHDLLAEAAAAHHGEEVKWLGDGLMVAFPSAADAVDCAIAMQQGARRLLHGEQVAIRVGLNAGEALREAADYFGLPVVIARRLCDRAEAGQILSSDVVTELLAGRIGFTFEPRGAIELKGVPYPVSASEIAYEIEPSQRVPNRMPFVGRMAELARLRDRLTDAATGRGGLVMLAGEPGIGKTRLTEELAEAARRDGWLVLWGRCLEGEWAPPYAPFVQAIEHHVAGEGTELAADLRPWAAPIAQLVPAVYDAIPGISTPPALQPDEERFRLLESVAQFLSARSRRVPLLLCLDDLQWADRGTIAMLRHVARHAVENAILVVGTYRDVEVDANHPLTDTLRALRREVEYDDMKLGGLAAAEAAELLGALGEHEVAEKVGAAWVAETDGNPFFIRELLRHFVEEGKVFRGEDGRWTTERPLRDLVVLPGMRDVVVRRLSRLPETASRLLGVAAAFEDSFNFDLITHVSGLSEDEALDALDAALGAQLVQPAGVPDSYMFANTVIRQTVYGELSPSRRVRLHRRVAEALEQAFGGAPSPAQAGEIAAQYHRSAGLPEAERGADFAIAAATHAETTGAHDDAARFLRSALDLLPENDERRPRLLGRLGIALAWAATFDEAVAAASQAGVAIAATEGQGAAADYLSEALACCLENVDRLAALEGLCLLDAPRRPELDRLTAEAAERLQTPLAFMNLIDDHRQFFAAFHGLEGEAAEARETPLDVSLCRYVAAFDEALRVNNALSHPLSRSLMPVTELGVRSYLGVPLRTRAGQAVGSFCVVDFTPRQWRPEDHHVLEELAQQAIVLTEEPAPS